MKYLAFLITILAFDFLGMNSISEPIEIDNELVAECATCHKDSTLGIHNQWAESKHAQNEISCIDCHEADESEIDAFEHNCAAMMWHLITHGGMKFLNIFI